MSGHRAVGKLIFFHMLKIKHKDIVYTIDKRKDYADFDSGLIIYIVVRGDTA